MQGRDFPKGREDMKMEKKQRDWVFFGVFTVQAFMCIVSICTSYEGLQSVMKIPWLAFGVAACGGALSLIVCYILDKSYAIASKEKRISYLSIMGIIAIAIFGCSTLWSVITVGGKDAIRVHMQKVLVDSDKMALRLRAKGSEEADLSPELNSLANQFDNLASRETSGAFSGLSGEGEVVSTLKNTAEMFRNLASSVQETEVERQRYYVRVKDSISEARSLLTEQKGEEIPIWKLGVKFSGKLADVNEYLTKMSEASSIDFVKIVSRNLEGLTLVTTQPKTIEQKDAIQALRQITSSAQAVVGKITDKAEFGEVELQTFAMIEMGSAIFIYFHKIIYAWASALALDFGPFLLVLLIALSYEEKQKAMTLEEAERTRFDVWEASREIMDDAGSKVDTLVEKAREEIEQAGQTVGRAVSEALESSAEGVVEDIRTRTQGIKQEFEGQMGTWREEFQKAKYRF